MALLPPGREPDRWVDECVTGHPDLLAVSLATHWTEDREPIAV